MKNVIKSFIVIMVMSLVLTSVNFNVLANNISNTESYQFVIPEDAIYTDNQVIVILDHDISIKRNINEMSYFTSVNCVNVTELTQLYTEKVDVLLESIATQGMVKTDRSIDLSGYHKIFCLELANPSHKNVIDSINHLNKIDGVLCAFPNYQITIDSYDDNLMTTTVDYYNPNDIYSKISLDDAWVIANQQNTIRIAVLDTGIDVNHEAFGQGINSIIDSTNSGTIRGTIYQTGTIPLDENGHGTHVAGIIAGAYNSQNGHRGVCNNVEIVAIKIFNSDGQGYLNDLVRAMTYLNSLSTEAAVDIVNISAGFLDRFYEMDLQTDLVRLIFGSNSLVVCSAGNNNEELVSNNRFPAGIDPLPTQTDNLITVGATDYDDTRWVHSDELGSNYSEDIVDIFAPGVKILSTMPMEMCENESCLEDRASTHISNGYHALTGTSMATPFVTGVAALMMSTNRNLSASAIKYLITNRNNVDYSLLPNANLYELNDLCVSGGRLNAQKAVLAAMNACGHSNASYTNNVNTHTMFCNLCGYQETTGHNLYVLADNGEDGVTIECSQCTYTYTCTDGVVEYGYSNPNGHNVSCTCGCYNFFAPHSPMSYVQTSSVSTHDALCSDCGTYYPDYHNWIEISSGYQCSICLKTSTIIPGEVQNLTDEELKLLLASLTDEELAELTLALNEDDRGRIAALLPEREDDLVTE